MKAPSACWPMRTVSGTTSPDVSGNAANGIIVGAWNYTPGRGWLVPQAAYMSIGYPAAVQVVGSDNFTWMALIYPTTLSSRYALISYRQGDNAPQLEIGTGSGGTARLVVTSTGHFDAESVNDVLTLNTVNHVAFRKSNSTTQALFVNGAQVSLSANAPIDYVDNALEHTVAFNNAAPWGYIQDVRMYASALDNSEIAAIYAAIVGSQSGLARMDP